MKKLITLLALCCLMVTGAWADVTFRAHRYDTFKVMPINENSIVFVGNSITDMQLWAEAFNNPNVVNRGNSGATSSEILANVRSYCAGHPAKIFLMIGINDKPNGSNTTTIVNNIKATVEAIQAESISTQIYVQSIMPCGNTGFSNNTYISQVNSAIQTMLNLKPGVTYIDVYTPLVGYLDQGGNYSYDKLHPTAASSQIWMETIKQYVNNTNRYPSNTVSVMTKSTLGNDSFGARATCMSMMPISSDDILFFGDEMVKNGEWNELLGNIHVKNRGTNWDYDKTVSSMTYCRGDIEATFATVSGVNKTAPKQILLYTGTGEVNGNTSISTLVSTYTGLVSLLRTYAPATSTKISLVGLMPTKGYDNSRVKQFNAALQSYAASATNVEYIDIYTALATNDQVNTKYFPANDNYLYGDGYIKVAEILAQHIEGCTPVTATQANLYRAKIAGTEISLDEAFFEEGWYKIQVGDGNAKNHADYSGKYLYANPHDYVIESTTYKYAIGLADSGSDPTAYVYITGSHDQWHMEFNHGRDNSYFVTTNCLYDKTTPGNLKFIPNDETNPTQWKIWGSWPEAPTIQDQGDFRWIGWNLNGPSVGGTSQIVPEVNNNCYFIFTKTDAPVYPEEEDPEEEPCQYEVGKTYIISSVAHGSYGPYYVIPTTSGACSISTTKPTGEQLWTAEAVTDNGDGSYNVSFSNNGKYLSFLCMTTENKHSIKINKLDVDDPTYVNLQDYLNYYPGKATDNRFLYMAVKDADGSIAWGATSTSQIRSTGYSYQFKITEIPAITYNFYVNGTFIGSKVVAETIGQAPTVSVPDYVNIVSGMPTTIVAGTTSYDVETSYKSSVPFTVGNTYFIDDWGVSGRHYLLYSNGTNVNETPQTGTYYDISSYAGNSSYHWTVGGDWLNGFTFKNGDGYYMKAPSQNPSDGTALVVSTTDEPLCHFDLKASGASSGKYTYTPHGGTNNVAHTSNTTLKLSFYQSYTGANLEATTFTFIPVAPTLQDHHLYTIKGAFNNNTYAPLVCENNVIKAGAATATPETFVFLETTHQNNAGLTPLFNLGTAEGTGFFAYAANGTANTTKANAVAVAFPTSSTSLSGGVVWDTNGFKSGYFGMVGVINTNTYRSYVVQPSSQINFNTRDNNDKISASNTLGATNVWCMNYVIEEVKGYTVYDLVVEGTVSGVTYQGATGNCLTTASQVNGGYFVVKNGVTLNESDFNVAGVPSGYTVSVAVSGTTITVNVKENIQAKINAFFSDKVGKVGYPSAENDLVVALEEYQGTAVTADNYAAAVAAYNAMIASDDIVLPEDGKAYRIKAVHVNADGTIKNSYNIYSTPTGSTNPGQITGSTSSTVTNARFIARRVENNEFILVNENGNYLCWFDTSNGTKSYNTKGCNEEYNATFNRIKLEHAANGGGVNSLTATQLFGVFQMSGHPKNDPSAYQYFCYDDGNHQYFVSGDPGNKFYNDNSRHTFLFQFVEDDTYTYNHPKFVASKVENEAVDGVYASIYLPFAMQFPEDVEVYAGTEETNVENNVTYLRLTKAIDDNGIAPKGAYILRSATLAANTTITVTPAAATPTGIENPVFFGTTDPDFAQTHWDIYKTMNPGKTPYILANKDSHGIGFYKLTGDMCPKGKAVWMAPSNTSAAVKFNFDDIISAIEALHGNTTNAAIYDLQGRRLDKVQKGQINVINGQKIMFK